MDVGIVIAVYNPRPHEFERAIESVRAQTVNDWECVVVDDGSAAPPPSVSDPRIRVVRQWNQGVSAARNRGAAMVAGDYVAFLDQDDHWRAEKLEEQIRFMKLNSLDVCDTDFDVVRGGEVMAGGYRDHQGSFEGLLSGGSIGLSTLMVRRGAFINIGGFDPRFSQIQDWVLVLALARLGYRLDRLRKTLATYELHDANATLNYRRTYDETMAIYDMYEALEERDEVEEAIRRGRAVARSLYAFQAIDAFRRNRRKGDLVWAARRRPDIVAGAIARKFVAGIRRG